MEPEFWHERWGANDIGFHEGAPNALLVAHFNTLALEKGSRVFVPLCGKTRDIHWLLGEGYRIAGAELSELAVTQLFEELGREPVVEVRGALRHYAAENVDIFAGDLFALTPEMLGKVDAVYDRAALVALPEVMRLQYRQHLESLCGTARQLLVTLEYKEGLIPGPPFSVTEAEVHAHYSATYAIHALESRYALDGLKGQYPVTERVWHLQEYAAN